MAEQPQWEIELTQLRQMMRNEMASHERIRDRVLRLQEWYYDGIIDGNINWERWATDRFAYNTTWLRFMSRPHPLSLDQAQRDQQRERDKLADDQRKFDASQGQIAWDGYVKELNKAKRAGMSVDVGAEDLRIKNGAKPKKKPVVRELAFPPPPPAEIAEPLLADCNEIERKSRFDLGLKYHAMRELAQTHKLGRNPETNKFWSWVQWAAVYIRRSRQDISKCIKLYEDNMSVVASGDIKQDQSVLPENVVNLPRK